MLLAISQIMGFVFTRFYSEKLLQMHRNFEYEVVCAGKRIPLYSEKLLQTHRNFEYEVVCAGKRIPLYSEKLLQTHKNFE